MKANREKSSRTLKAAHEGQIDIEHEDDLRKAGSEVIPNVLSDEDLMALVHSGDSGSLEVLYDRYASTIMGLGLKIVGDSHIAEEVLQETFLRVWHHAENFQANRGGFTSWLMTIARNLSIDALRRQRLNQSYASPAAFDQDAERIPDPSADIDKQAWASIAHARVRRALESLPEKQRQVLELAYFRNMTRQEIATVIGAPLGTIHTRVRLALEKLRDALKFEEPEG